MPLYDLQWGSTPDCVSASAGEPFYHLAEYDFGLSQMLLLVGIAVPMNVFIVASYAFGAPPHPKFLLRTWNYASIMTHILSGTAEIIFGVAMWFAPNPAPLVQLQCVFSLVHSLTALNQMPLLFGTKVVMNPTYAVCVVVKLYLGVNTFFHPTCYKRALALTCVHTIYAWVRMIWIFLKETDIFRESQYSVANLCAVMLIMPAISIVANVVLFLSILGYFFYVKLCLDPTVAKIYMQEHSRDTKALTRFQCPFAQTTTTMETNAFGVPQLKASPQDQARAVFKMVDTDSDGAIEVNELAELLTSFGMSEYEVGKTAELYGTEDGKITFETFETKLSAMWKFIYYEGVVDKIAAGGRTMSEKHISLKHQNTAKNWTKKHTQETLTKEE